MSYRRWSFIAILLFAIGLIFGLATPASITSTISEDIDALEEFGGTLASLPPILTATLIFAKNASVLLFSFVLSPIFCLIPIMALTVNGWMLAIVSTIAVEKESFGFVLAAVLPHGIIELPALILAEVAALSFGTIVTLSLFKKERRRLVLPNFRQNLKYLMIALALLLPAAIIETYITPLFLK
ncbi:MAG TPA: stage II sporulation protein M [Dehalococcoidia bacterium]|jgi:stage II sporulation protein M|nr:stage II sporulation protein M [Dehalococcoidia bacterium]